MQPIMITFYLILWEKALNLSVLQLEAIVLFYILLCETDIL